MEMWNHGAFEADEYVDDDEYTELELYGPGGPPTLSAEEREARRPVIAHPTLASEVVRARAELDLQTEIALAVRAGRSAAGLSQRAFAEAVQLPRWVIERIETHADTLALETVLALLRRCDHDLLLVRRAEDGSVESVPPEEWPAAELIARETRGRQLPAHATAGRTCVPRHWVPYDDPRWRCETPLWTWSKDDPPDASARLAS